MSRWAGDVLVAMNDDRFRAMIVVANDSRRVLDWFVHYLLKKRPNGQPLSLARLVWYRGRSLRQDMLKRLQPDMIADVVDTLPLVVADDAYHAIEVFILRQVTDFDRRIVERFGRMPLKALWVANRPPSERCPTRMRCCQEIWDTHTKTGKTHRSSS